jgi:hypothetical protein
MNLTTTEQLVLVTISTHSKGNEITGTKVANSVGLKPRDTGKEGADLRSIINALRRKGYPVCANGKGYFWPKNQDEILDYQESLSKRLDKIKEAYDGIQLAMEVSRNQPPLGLVESLHKNMREI